MAELLTRVLDSHGGLHRWSKVHSASFRLSLDGPFWEDRGWPQVRRKQIVTLDPHREHMTFTPFTGTSTTAIFDGDDHNITVRIKDAGEVLEERANPAGTFPPFTEGVQWDSVQMAYYMGAGLWNSFVEPYVFISPGMETQEIERWEEDQQIWRRLQVTYPQDFPTLSPVQVFYYDSNLLQRRVDSEQVMLGGMLLSHYFHDPQTYEGMVFYTRQVVYFRDGEGNVDKSFPLLTIDVDSVSVECK